MQVLPERFVLTGVAATMDGRGAPDAGAVAVRDGRIDRVGDVVVDEWGPSFTVGSRTIMPGFVDPHTHAAASCIALSKVDCRAPRHATIDDVLQELRDGLWRASDTGWLVGQANLFFDMKLREGRYPTARELDSVSRDVAIAIQAGGHVSLLNTKAMELARIERFMKDVSGSSGKALVETGADGKPTGVVSEIDSYLPLPETGGDELRDLIKAGIHTLFTRHGVTSIGEMSDSVAALESLRALIAEGQVHPRFDVYLWAPRTLPFHEAVAWPEHLPVTEIDERFEIAGVKVFSDGGYSARNAATLTPYAPGYSPKPEFRGQLALQVDELRAMIAAVDSAGLQLAVHSNGERAQREVAAASAGRVSGRPVRMEHAGNLRTDPATSDAWREGNVIPVPQPVFIYNFGAFIPRILHPNADRGQFPFRTLLDDGWRLSGSSDNLLGSEERQTEPLFGVWCAVARRGFLGEVIEPDQSVSIEEALLMHTLYAAEALGVGATRGSLRPGKVADLVVLDRDPRAVGVDDLLKVNVDIVISGGRVVYQREGSEPLRLEDVG